MLLDDLDDLLDAALSPLGARREDGEDFTVPPLQVRCYFRRAVRLHWLPAVGRALAIVAVVHAPDDLGSSAEDSRALLDRVGRAVNSRFPPLTHGNGLSIGLTAVVVTPEPIGPDDETRLDATLSRRRAAGRSIPLGIFRINLGQEALAYSVSEGPDGLFREPAALAEALSNRLGRFLPPMTDAG